MLKDKLIVKISKENTNSLPFGCKFKTRLGTAIVLSFYGDSDDVSDLMQKTSHTSRAYFINANQLKGFLQKGITSILWDLCKSSQFEEATKYQVVDMNNVFTGLKILSSQTKRDEFLKISYPCLFVYIMKQRGQKKALTDYMNRCKRYKDHLHLYYLYVHGYFIPWLQEQRESGKIKFGHKAVNNHQEYSGELDENGKACGIGVL